MDTSKAMRFHKRTVQNSKKPLTLVNKPLECTKLAQKDRNVKIKWNCILGKYVVRVWFAME